MEVVASRKDPEADLWENLLRAGREPRRPAHRHANLRIVAPRSRNSLLSRRFQRHRDPARSRTWKTTHISFTKGCYTGQEIVERVRSRGQVNRRRVRLKFSGAEPPAPGTRLSVDGKELGLVTSSAFSPKENTAIGMGYSRREHDAPGSVLEVDDGTAEVIA